MTALRRASYDPHMPTLIDNPKRARQLARAIASDLTLYHEPKILEGIANDNLFDAMADEIKEGSELFKSRVTADKTLFTCKQTANWCRLSLLF